MLVNSQMTALLQELSINKKEVSHTSLLLKLLWPEFIDVNGCILLSEQLAKSHAKQDDFEDETGFEAFVNHIHFTDKEFGEKLVPIELLGLTVKIAEMWQAKLSWNFPNDKFLIILSFDENETTLRFHKIRESQLLWINLEKIEKYEEPIMVIEVD